MVSPLGRDGARTCSAPMWMVPRRWPPDAASNVDIHSWQGRTAGHGSWSCLVRLVGDGLTRAGTSSASCPERRPRREPPLLQQQVRHAWVFRWGSMLACSAARAFALSLLEQRGGQGVDGPTPLDHDVMWEGRYVT